MKQLLQSLKTGVIEVVDAPIPKCVSGSLVVKSSNSLISAGTERTLVNFGRSGWIDKARRHPEKVEMVLNKFKTDGISSTIGAVRSKLERPITLGYCNAGRVVACGNKVSNFKIGDRVVSNGCHAEFVSVPQNLCAKIPDAVSDEEAAFTVLGAVALQGIRLCAPMIGETVVVVGLGLVGLLTVQMLRSNGCRVLGIDTDAARLEIAKQFGVEVFDRSGTQDPVSAANFFSRGRGVDAVILTLATQSSEPVHEAALMCRKRGKIILVGVTGLELSREDFYEKELIFQVSASYGPGRYDPDYEDKGQDYPMAFVRWTAQRNFEAVLDMLASGALDVKPLISHYFDFSEASEAYELISSSSRSLGIVLNYSSHNSYQSSSTVSLRKCDMRDYSDKSDSGLTAEKNYSKKLSAHESCHLRGTRKEAHVSFIGSGNYATSVLMPAFKKAGVDLCCVVSANGVSGLHAARKFGFSETSTDSNFVFNDSVTDAIVISTRHNTHAPYVLQALEAGKHVFVEKPLCLTLEELTQIEAAYSSENILMVGFNRRFAPQVKKIKSLIEGVKEPKSIIMTVNAGMISPDHWTQDLDVGGGRIVGEVCHFVDLLRFLVGEAIVSYRSQFMDSRTRDTVTVQINFADGSIGTIHYFANGSSAFPKERLEVFAAGGVIQLDNYRKLRFFGWRGHKKIALLRQDKGQNACVRAFIEAVATSSAAPIPFNELIEVSRVSIELAQS